MSEDESRDPLIATAAPRTLPLSDTEPEELQPRSKLFGVSLRRVSFLAQ